MKQKDIRSILRDMYLGEAYRPEEVERALASLRSLIQAEKKKCDRYGGSYDCDRCGHWNMALDRVLEMMT